MKKPLTVAWGIGCTLIALSAVWAAATGTRPESGFATLSVGPIISTVVYGLIGIVLAILGFKLFDVLIPFNLEQEICEKHNLAVAILCAAMVLGICIIVAAAVL
ncbi:MAG: DUF350 domain-containing protein [Abditibacteriales bacterium]|nr:DUF350 domain-containing protein [Abditibacteriales bacterium]MDW8364803.1 DUF350 domain-containing protein [Abditibacteriales bacterium]